MKLLTHISITGLFCLVTACTAGQDERQATCMKTDLTGVWEFANADTLLWGPAIVPGTVHTDLLEAGRIDDPFWRDNEQRQQWIDKTDWVYRKVFTVEKKAWDAQMDLVFEGLDTYADVSLNGCLILSADNMFRTWEIPVKEYLREGENELEVYFHSPIKMTLPLYDALPYKHFASPDDSQMGGLGDKKVSMFARKVPSHYGWDWGPRFVTSGIWKPVYLRKWEDARISGVQYVTRSLDKKKAAMTASIEFQASRQTDARVVISVDGRNVKKSKVKLTPGQNKIDVDFEIQNPELWWPNGMGEQRLYQMEVCLSTPERKLDSSSEKTGLRTIRHVQQPDEWGTSFYFEVNGRPVFAKGANLIPTDNFLTRTGREKYNALVRSVADANMNMIRVWGGGIYEDNRFYDACDSLGIMVWQDFMFACSMYPADDAFHDSVAAEAVDNIKRLRNRASLALWCGNNEITQAWYRWGWSTNKKTPQKYLDEMWKGYERIFFNTLPALIAEHDPARTYWPSSPSSSFDQPQNLTAGDVHYWQYRQHKLPVAVFREQTGRFMSEYGFNSAPSLSTIEAFTEPDDRNFSSPVFRGHVKSRFEPELMLHYIAEDYDSKTDFGSAVVMGQIYQADAIKYTIEQHRLNIPFCMGSLYWQLNDCWPGSSWSTIDYFGNWKAAHYAVKRAFSPDHVVADVHEGTVRIYGITERSEPLDCILSCEVVSLDGTMVASFQKSATLDPNTSTLLCEKTVDDILKGNPAEETLLVIHLQNDSGVIVSNTVEFVRPKELKLADPGIEVLPVPVPDGVELTLTSDTYTKYVVLSHPDRDVFFADNYFDLLPGVPHKVMVRQLTDPETISVDNYLKYKKD